MDKFIKLFAEAIEREDEIKMEDEFRNYEEWSSIAYISVIAMMDEEYDTQIEEADVLYRLCMMLALRSKK